MPGPGTHYGFQFFHDPFPHAVFDGLGVMESFRQKGFPAPDPGWPWWEVEYADAVQRGKRTTRDIAKLAADLRRHELSDLFGFLQSPAWVQRLQGMFGIPLLEVDDTLHGGGVHVMPGGSRLLGHLDYARHPIKRDKQRALNAIAFLGAAPEWPSDWGGELQLMTPGGNPKKRIYPFPGRVVVFETSDLSYHGVASIVAEARDRVTAAVYYLQPHDGRSTRERALFFPR